MVKKKKKKPPGGSGAVKNPVVRFETTQGAFIAELFADVPVTVKNFLDLASSGFYDGLIFHRYVPDFVIQGGDPEGTGMGGSSRTIPLEITAHKHLKGSFGMARTQDPDSASSQFYICLSDIPHLDGGYAVFGRVTEGLESVLRLRQGDRMTKVAPAGDGRSKK